MRGATGHGTEINISLFSMTTPVIEFSHVTKKYRKHFWTGSVIAVDTCSFSVDKNTVTGFVGPNGAGKTTSIKMIMGLMRPDAGAIRINGIDPVLPASRKGVSFLSERPYFYDHLSVVETLRFAFRLQGGNGKSENSAIDGALEAVELRQASAMRVKDLSKGMQQRLSMAQALLCDPGLFILDEPMSGLDPLGRRLFRRLFTKLAQRGKSIFFSSHILDDVESLCSNVVVLSQGRLLYQGAISQLVAQGFLGTELSVTSLADATRAELTAMGYSVTQTADKECMIFVPADKDLKKCQAYLHEQGIACNTISKRNASLEDSIYNSSKKG
jgi:ABC-2 type transport system ATP-binding protein